MTDTYAKVSNTVESKWYPFHGDEWFTHNDICREFGWKEAETKHNLSKKLYHDYKERKPPYLEKNGKAFRIIDEYVEEIDWQNADTTKTIDLILPFDLHNYVRFYSKSIIVVAGEANAGKSAFLYNVLLENMYDFNITLYNSETSPEQMKERFELFGIEIPNPAPFKVVERYDNFADVIDPHGFSIVDYIDADNDFWSIGAELSRIHRVLGYDGICVAAIQKKAGQKNLKGQVIEHDTGYGGDLTKKRAALYVSMTASYPHKLKVVKGKSWKNPQCNPNGMEFTYKLLHGAKFIDIEEYHPENI